MADGTGRLRIDLHCHSSASFDGSVDPLRLLALARTRGLTHLAITDHDTIDGALRARDAAPTGIAVIVGQEARTREGDVIALFVEKPIPSRLSLEETVALVREQGGLVGLAHPFDVYRPSVGRGVARPEQSARLAELVDYVEIHNGRVTKSDANARAADFGREFGLPGVAVSDAHTEAEIGLVATLVEGPISGPGELLAGLKGTPTMQIRERSSQRQSALRRVRGRLRR